MHQPRVDLTDPIVAGIALGKRLESKGRGGGYRLVGAPEDAPKHLPGKVVLGVAIPGSSKVQAFR